MLGQGELTFNYKDFKVFDGVIHYSVLSPSLIYRLLNPKPTRPFIAGKWLAIKGCIVWFHKEKYIYRHYSLKETYSRKEMMKAVI